MENLEKKEILIEKILFEGGDSLSDLQLLSLIMGRGETNTTQSTAASALVNKLGGIENFSKESIEQCRSLTKRERVFALAQIAMSQRVAKSALSHIKVVNNRHDISQIFSPLIGNLNHEELWVVCLNSANRVIETIQLSKGTDNSSIFDMKILMRRVLNNLSSRVILVHNHPNLLLEPSPEDLQTTHSIKQSLGFFDITLLDHVIICAEDSYSFAEHDLI